MKKAKFILKKDQAYEFGVGYGALLSVQKIKQKYKRRFLSTTLMQKSLNHLLNSNMPSVITLFGLIQLL